MFIPKAFREDNFDTIQQFIVSHPQATLIAQTNDGMEACHIPIYWQNDPTDAGLGVLFGHIAKINPLNDMANLKKDWLIIFQDTGHYISPNWYLSKALTHKEVPTWNYRSVHVTGTASLLTQPDDLVEILNKLTTDYEATQPVPWSLTDAPAPYIEALCRAIVGIRMDIKEIQAQFKLSQNKSAENKAGVITGLQSLGSAKANAMANLIPL